MSGETAAELEARLAGVEGEILELRRDLASYDAVYREREREAHRANLRRLEVIGWRAPYQCRIAECEAEAARLRKAIAEEQKAFRKEMRARAANH